MASFPELYEFSEQVQQFAIYKRTIQGCSEKTVNEYMLDLRTFFRYLIAKEKGIDIESEDFIKIDITPIDADYLSKIKTEQIYEFLFYTGDTRKNMWSAKARKLSAIKGLYKYMTLKRNYFEENPAINIESPKPKKALPKFLNLDESMLLLQAILNDEESNTKERDYCIVTLFLNCGMRLSELTGINLFDLDREYRSLRVLGKGNKERIIYLNEACADALKRYIAVRARDGEPKDKNALFISRNHRRISNQMVQKIVYKYLDMADLGYKKCSVHKLRHTAATLMYQTGKVDVRVLKDILGHEQLNTTQIYTHVSDKGMEEAMRQNPLAKKTGKKNG
ncbi:MAG: tyrosine-type recombinase/integrase [Clostridia bacterium]|nr:tyrosine-type recombinase/integrase [Clostridia bacterium]